MCVCLFVVHGPISFNIKNDSKGSIVFFTAAALYSGAWAPMGPCKLAAVDSYMCLSASTIKGGWLMYTEAVLYSGYAQVPQYNVKISV